MWDRLVEVISGRTVREHWNIHIKDETQTNDVPAFQEEEMIYQNICAY